MQNSDSAPVGGLEAVAEALSILFYFCFPPTSPCRYRDKINCSSFQISIHLNVGLSGSAGACCDRWKRVEVVYDSTRNFAASLQQEFRIRPIQVSDVLRVINASGLKTQMDNAAPAGQKMQFKLDLLKFLKKLHILCTDRKTVRGLGFNFCRIFMTAVQSPFCWQKKCHSHCQQPSFTKTQQ